MGRSYVRAKNCEYEGALQDINKALKNDPNDLVLLAHKALNIYLSCEFEDALVFNYRLVPKRKKPDNFTMGVMHVSASSIIILVRGKETWNTATKCCA